VEGQREATEKLQEIVRADVNQMKLADYQESPGPNGFSWFKFNRPFQNV
jgi:hypothetical protein